VLQLRDLHAYYGASHVLHGVSLDVRPGEIVALLGRNGSGRSTTAKAVMGLVAGRGSVTWHGVELLGRAPFEIARRGVGYVPESRDIFGQMTVHQNLVMGRKPGRIARPAGDSRQQAPPWTFDDLYELFPRLRERQQVAAGLLSGGEQQMLALARTMMGNPALVLIDEPTEGLAPKVVGQVALFLQALRARGVAVLLIEQKLTIALEVSQRCCVMGQGRVVFEGSPEALRADPYVRQEWLEV
jgi:branched-chain amino acid transport system ATP-binding protein